MCSRTCASPRWSSASSTEPAWTASRSSTRFSGRGLRRMKNLRPFGSVPVRTLESTGSGALRSCADVAGAHKSASSATTAASEYDRSMQIRIRRLDATVPLPTYATAESAGFDLSASAEVTVAPRQIALIPTGLVIEVPRGYFLGIFARSSTPLKRGLMVANGVGVVDPDYAGPDDEVRIQVLNVSTSDVTIKPGDRIAQGIVLPAPRVTWEEATILRQETRGGFGSTGG